MNVQQLKVFGERNTGTNWLENLLMKNYDVPVIHHREILKRHITNSEKKFIASLPRHQRKFMQEHVNDSIFENHSHVLFGWKHASVLSESVENHAEFKETGFICIVKHPYSFVKSLHKRPYNALTETPRRLNKFIATPWPTLARDNINVPLLQSPVELWNYKVSSYFKLIENNSNAVLLRYESLLENHELLFDVLAEKFSLKAKSRLPIIKSSKSDKLVTNDYKKKYLKNKTTSHLASSSIHLMRSILDEDIVQKCQYNL